MMYLLLTLAVVAQDQTIEQLVERLRSTEVADQNKATAEIIQRGKSALPFLEKTVKDVDPKVASRISQVMDVIDAHIQSPHLRELALILDRFSLADAPGFTIESLANELIPKRRDSQNFYDFYMPHWIVSFKREEGWRYIVVEGPGSVNIRSNLVYLFHLFDKQGTFHGTTRIALGHGLIASRAYVAYEEFDHHLIGVELGGQMDRGGVRERQYYALQKDAIVLVRIEDSMGEPLRNLYAFEGNVRGPSLPLRTSKEWVEALRSKEVPTVLNALVWLGGTHVAPMDGDLAPGMESWRDALVADQVRRDPNVRALLEEYRTSRNLWIREAAGLALTPSYQLQFPQFKLEEKR